MQENLKQALDHPIWKDHKIGNKYSMDGDPDWELVYYPLFENGKTGEVYEEPRALIQKEGQWGKQKGMDRREVPLMNLTRKHI